MYSSVPISMLNMNALAQILFFTYFAHKIFKFCFQNDIIQKRDTTRTRKKMGQVFLMKKM